MLRTMNVRFGSKADIRSKKIDVRFTPKSGHRLSVLECPLCAKSGLMHCSKKDRYPINSSARAISDCGTVRSSALAVARLITSSYLVGACTARSPGFSPLCDQRRSPQSGTYRADRCRKTAAHPVQEKNATDRRLADDSEQPVRQVPRDER